MYLSSTEECAVSLIDAGWFQVSRRHLMLARLPEGMTGIEALIEARLKSIGGIRPDYWPAEIRRWAEAMGESRSAEHFRRVYAKYVDGLTCTIDHETFEAFRHFGGSTR